MCTWEKERAHYCYKLPTPLTLVWIVQRVYACVCVFVSRCWVALIESTHKSDNVSQHSSPRSLLSFLTCCLFWCYSRFPWDHQYSGKRAGVDPGGRRGRYRTRTVAPARSLRRVCALAPRLSLQLRPRLMEEWKRQRKIRIKISVHMQHQQRPTSGTGSWGRPFDDKTSTSLGNVGE